MNTKNLVTFSLFALAIFGSAITAHAADDSSTEALLKKSKCSTCHALDKKKVGPSYKDISKKYKDVAGAEQRLYLHLITHPKVNVDGVEEQHVSLQSSNEAEIRAAIKWILAR